MTQPAPDVEALAEALAELRGELAEFRRERDALLSTGTRSSGAYGGHLRSAAAMASYLSKRGWRLVPAGDKPSA